MGDLLLFLGGTVFGWFSLVAYGAWRAVGSDGWDDSNVFNFLRVLLHLFLHPEDFARMFYLDEREFDLIRYETGEEPERPFDYLDKDEFSENFPGSRP